MKYLIMIFAPSVFLFFPFVTLAQGPDGSEIISCWNMDEESGVRYDAIGSNDLTDFNSVGSGPGLVGNAAQFVGANEEFLQKGNNNLYIGDNPFTFLVWVNPDHQTQQFVAGRWETNSGNSEWRIDLDGDVSFDVRDFSVVANGVSVSQSITNGWHLLTIWHDPGNDEIGLQIDNGTPVTATHTNNVAVQNNIIFRLGRGWYAPNLMYFDGDMDTAVAYASVLSASQRDWMWNEGNGRSCDQLLAVTVTTPGAAVHQLTLPSGDRAELTMSATAGDVFTSGVVVLLLVVVLFDALRQIAFLTSKR